jgi:hypothetical protein
MFVPRREPVHRIATGLILAACALVVGCGEEHSDFGRLTPLWAGETAEFAGPASTATLLALGVAGDVCATESDPANAVDLDPKNKKDEPVFQWETWVFEQGNPIPTNPILQDALASVDEDGTPLDIGIVSLDGFGGDIEVKLAPVRLLDRTEACVRINTSHPGTDLVVTLTFLDASEDGIACAEEFALVTATVQFPCTTDEAYVGGVSAWTDLDEVEHTVSAPPEATGGAGLKYSATNPYLPCQGTLGWSAIHDGERRTFVSTEAYTMFDAEQPIEGPCPAVDSWTAGDPTTLPYKSWSGAMSATGWSETASLPIDPEP